MDCPFCQLEKHKEELIEQITKQAGKIIQLQAELADEKEENKRLKEGLESIVAWTKAYPLQAFPEPDFKKVAEVLKAAGLSLEQVSASNMRHVITKIKDITEQALKESE